MTTEAKPTIAPDREAALLERYRQERAKRIRGDGNAQYRKTEGELSYFLNDPFAPPAANRPALHDEVDVLIVGAGWSGLLTAARLRRAGVHNFRLVDSAADFGGVWYWNRYPGCRCDVESYIYMPLLEELGYMPTEKYATSDEIRGHALSVARHFDLYPHAVFQTRVEEAKWDDTARRWIVTTDRNDAIRARFLFVGNGPLNYPKLPAIPGVEDFKGHAFHTCRWDYDYTGGSPSTELTKLKDKRVAVIGTGCSGVQVVPPLGQSAGQLYVVQRTPAIVAVRGNRKTETGWQETLKPGWHQERMANFESVLQGMVRDVDLVDDEWTELWEPPLIPEGAGPKEIADLVRTMDLAKMEGVRTRVDEIVKDPATAESLKPYYGRYCKRPTFNDDYLPTFNRPNVKLVDTQGRGLDRITENAIVFGDQSYEIDCIIYATGFEVVSTSHKSAGLDIVGRGGETLDRKWSEAVKSLHGLYTHGFPNLFIVAGLRQGAPTLNFPHMAEEQASHAAEVVAELLRRDIQVMEVTQAAEDRWGAAIIAKSKVDLDYMRDCTPSILNAEGHLEELAKQTFTTAYGGGPFEYIDLLKAWREGGYTQDLSLTPA